MPEHMVSFAGSFADPGIPWPERGTEERVLCDRDGWEKRAIPCFIAGEAMQIDAMCKGELAVNVMVGARGESLSGFAICIAATGWRLSYGGAVFARCNDAMSAAESMMVASTWGEVERGGFGVVHRQTMKAIITIAERRGQICLDRVYPW